MEHCRRDEAKLVARRTAAIAGLLWHRTADAEDPASDDQGYALIAGFTKTSAEVAAVLNIAPMTASQMVGHAEALHTRLPRVARLLADGTTDWRTVRLVITRTELVDGDLMPELDRSLAERISGWQCWSRHWVINAVDAAVIVADPEAAKERRVSADTARHVNVTAEPNGMAKLRGAFRTHRHRSRGGPLPTVGRARAVGDTITDSTRFTTDRTGGATDSCRWHRGVDVTDGARPSHDPGGRGALSRTAGRSLHSEAQVRPRCPRPPRCRSGPG